jgi:hypothetical protein
MKSGFFLNIIVRQSSSIFELFSSENKSLLVRWNAFFILNFGFYIFNGIRSLNVKGNGFASQSLNKNLHTTSQSKNQMKSGLLLDVIIRQSSSIFELFSSKNKSLLVRWNSFFILNFGFNILDGVRCFNI